MKIKTFLLLATIIMGCEKVTKEQTIITIKEVSGFTSWSEWTTYSDSSHTVSRTVDLEVFPYSVNFSFVDNPKNYLETDFRIYYPKFDYTSDGYAMTVWNSEYKNRVFVILPHAARIDNNTKSHEVTHAVDQVMEKLGLEGTECRAYLVGYLMKKIEDAPEWKASEVNHILYSGTGYRTK
jgi:hypothetical protein